MNAQSKKLTQLAASILMVLAVGNVYSDVNDITIEGVGDYNESNLDVKGGTNANVRIYQVNDGITGSSDTNFVGDDSTKLTIGNNNNTKTVRIGQGAYYNPLDPDAVKTIVTNGDEPKDGAHSNTVTGTIANGTVVVNQTSSGNTVNFTNSKTINGIQGAGQVTVLQGNQNALGGGGSGFTANIAKSGSGDLLISQGAASGNSATSGTVNVIQGAGDSDVSITQLADGGVTKSGTVSVNTTGSGGSLTITQTDNGRTYVNSTGEVANTQAANALLNPATITGTIVLVNDMNNGGVDDAGAGMLALKNGLGTVKANVTGTGGTVVIDSNGGGAGLGTHNNIFINTLGTTGNAGPLTVTGSLTVAQSGNDYSTIAVKAGGSGVSGAVDISQTGNYQLATFNSVNGSSGNYHLTQNGTGESTQSVINVDF